MGKVAAVVFFGLAYITAITSAVSLMEVPVSSLMDKFNFQRGKAVWLVNLFLFLAGIPSALNLNILGTVDSYLVEYYYIRWIPSDFLYGMGCANKIR